MGVWCDFERNQCIEKTGAIRILSDGAQDLLKVTK